MRHRRCGEQTTAGTRDPSRDAHRARSTRGIRCDSGVRVHLSIKLRDEHKRQPPLDRFHDTRARPHVAPAVEPIPGLLRPRADLLERHRLMGDVQPRAPVLWNEPMLRDGNTVHVSGAVRFVAGPFLEVDGARKRSQQHKLRKGQAGLLRAYPVRMVIAGHFHYDQDEGEIDHIRYVVMGATGGQTKMADRASGGVNEVGVLTLHGDMAEIELLPLDGKGPLPFSSRMDMDRVQALGLVLGNLYYFKDKNSLCELI